ncbi:MAG: hypothetical protein ACK41D_10830 [Rubricoccaceae bacterium]
MPAACRLAALLILTLLVACTDRPGDRLAGTWRQATDADSLGMRYTFFADGRARIVSVPAEGTPQSYDARFFVADDSLLTLADEQGTEQFVFRLRGDTLVLGSRDGPSRTHLVRVR